MAEGPSGDVVTSAEQAEIARLAAPVAGERSWERLARLRRLGSVIDEVVRRETPDAIVDSRTAGIETEDLAEQWRVKSSWIYKLVPVRKRKTQ